MPDPAEVGKKVLAALAPWNAARQADALLLTDRIRAIDHGEPGLSAREVQFRLIENFDGDVPGVRTVQRHLKKIRDTRRPVAGSHEKIPG